MAPPRPHQTVEYKTIDGVTLEGWFWEVEGPAPAIIMTHGVSLEDLAVVFLSSGIPSSIASKK
jgi:hypothetical protein